MGSPCLPEVANDRCARMLGDAYLGILEKDDLMVARASQSAARIENASIWWMLDGLSVWVEK